MLNITNFKLWKLSRFKKIFVLVSGGIDSTYLWHIISEKYPDKSFAVNCWNPYEQSPTLRELKGDTRFIEIKPIKELDYKNILDKSFQKIPTALLNRVKGKYSKKVFPCCKYIKHDAFKKHEMFKEENTVVVSGIKYADGRQRQLFLKSLVNGASYGKGVVIKDAPTYFHRHKEGQLYCYPYRDYKSRELPVLIVHDLRKIYPNLKHSGCTICPVLVVFKDKFIEPIRTENSIRYYENYLKNKFEKKDERDCEKPLVPLGSNLN